MISKYKFCTDRNWGYLKYRRMPKIQGKTHETPKQIEKLGFLLFMGNSLQSLVFLRPFCDGHFVRVLVYIQPCFCREKYCRYIWVTSKRVIHNMCYWATEIYHLSTGSGKLPHGSHFSPSTFLKDSGCDSENQTLRWGPPQRLAVKRKPLLAII